MRTPLISVLATLVLIASAASAISQTKAPDPNAPGQSERSADPRNTEPESMSHNADKPKEKSKSGKAASNQGKDKNKKSE